MWNYNYIPTSELYHWGVKGQKWGVRRYRNKDGTLTEAGKKRYSEMSDDARAVEELRRKPVEQMSNSELQKLNQRQQLEAQHRQLNPSSLKKGMAITATVAAGLGTVATLYANGDRLIKIGNEVANKFKNKQLTI